MTKPIAGLSAIVPVLNDDDALRGLLCALEDVHVVVVDAAVAPATQALCAELHADYVAGSPGRGLQISQGINRTSADWLWVVHADTHLERAHVETMAEIVRTAEPCWGRFDISIPGVQMVAWFMNHRSRLTKICTGDQAIFVHRDLLDAIGGMPAIPLMEDIALTSALKRQFRRRFRPLHTRLETSPRRWQRRGVVRTILSMWSFRLRYYFGADAERLYREYYG